MSTPVSRPVRRIAGDALRLIVRRPALYLGLLLAPLLPAVGGGVVLGLLLPRGVSRIALLLIAVPLIVLTVGFLMSMAPAMVQTVAGGMLGERLTVGDALRRGRIRAGRMLRLSLLLGGAMVVLLVLLQLGVGLVGTLLVGMVMAGTLPWPLAAGVGALVVVGLLGGLGRLLTGWTLAVPALALEPTLGARASLRRAFALARYDRAKVFRAEALTFGVTAVLPAVLQGVGSLVAQGALLGIAVPGAMAVAGAGLGLALCGVVLNVLGQIFWHVTTALVYLDLRIHHEGLTPELLQAALPTARAAA